MHNLSDRILKTRGISRLIRVYSRLFGGTLDVSSLYDEGFFNKTLTREAPSAEAVAQILFDEFHPKSVIDVGCGLGIYLRAFEKLGAEVSGFDGSKSAIRNNLVSQDHLKLLDLRKPHSLGRRWDLCICFEVAEHLQAKYATCIVKTVTGASNRVIFTAALPGQGGTCHFNEQPQDYWKRIFESQGFEWRGDLVAKLRNQMREKSVVFWVEQNLMVFERQS